MKKKFFYIMMTLALCTVAFISCKKDKSDILSGHMYSRMDDFMAEEYSFSNNASCTWSGQFWKGSTFSYEYDYKIENNVVYIEDLDTLDYHETFLKSRTDGDVFNRDY